MCAALQHHAQESGANQGSCKVAQRRKHCTTQQSSAVHKVAKHSTAGQSPVLQRYPAASNKEGACHFGWARMAKSGCSAQQCLSHAMQLPAVAAVDSSTAHLVETRLVVGMPARQAEPDTAICRQGVSCLAMGAWSLCNSSSCSHSLCCFRVQCGCRCCTLWHCCSNPC
jgi:hypothetical protein